MLHNCTGSLGNVNENESRVRLLDGDRLEQHLAVSANKIRSPSVQQLLGNAVVSPKGVDG
jgi:hypothetical protein